MATIGQCESDVAGKNRGGDLLVDERVKLEQAHGLAWIPATE
jgi:hypothetical protein